MIYAEVNVQAREELGSRFGGLGVPQKFCSFLKVIHPALRVAPQPRPLGGPKPILCIELIQEVEYATHR